MTIELTPASASAVVGILLALGGALVAIGNLQWYKRSEGADLARAVTALTETVKNISHVENAIQEEGRKREESDRRVHARVDDLAKDVQRLVGIQEGARS